MTLFSKRKMKISVRFIVVVSFIGICGMFAISIHWLLSNVDSNSNHYLSSNGIADPPKPYITSTESTFISPSPIFLPRNTEERNHFMEFDHMDASLCDWGRDSSINNNNNIDFEIPEIDIVHDHVVAEGHTIHFPVMVHVGEQKNYQLCIAPHFHHHTITITLSSSSSSHSHSKQQQQQQQQQQQVNTDFCEMFFSTSVTSPNVLEGWDWKLDSRNMKEKVEKTIHEKRDAKDRNQHPSLPVSLTKTIIPASLRIHTFAPEFQSSSPSSVSSVSSVSSSSTSDLPPIHKSMNDMHSASQSKREDTSNRNSAGYGYALFVSVLGSDERVQHPQQHSESEDNTLRAATTEALSASSSTTSATMPSELTHTFLPKEQGPEDQLNDRYFPPNSNRHHHQQQQQQQQQGNVGDGHDIDADVDDNDGLDCMFTIVVEEVSVEELLKHSSLVTSSSSSTSLISSHKDRNKDVDVDSGGNKRGNSLRGGGRGQRLLVRDIVNK